MMKNGNNPAKDMDRKKSGIQYSFNLFHT